MGLSPRRRHCANSRHQTPHLFRRKHCGSRCDTDSSRTRPDRQSPAIRNCGGGSLPGYEQCQSLGIAASKVFLTTAKFLIQALSIMSKLVVYGTPASTYVRTVRLLLEEIAVDYTLHRVDILNGENQSAEYLAKHPFGKVPTIEVNGELLYETAVITEYLDATLADRKFSFFDPMLQARMRQIMAIIDSYLFGPAIGSIVVQRLILPSLGRNTDEAKVKNAIAPAQTAIEAIESLAADSTYLLGSEASIADFYLIPILMYLFQTPEFEVITAQTPKLRRWRDELSQLPNVQKLCAKLQSNRRQEIRGVELEQL